jgi:chorismate synthase
MEQYPVRKIEKPIDWCVTVPGSKSMTNRALLMAALSDGTVTLDGVLFSDDSRHFISSLTALGFDVLVEEEKRRVTVKGEGGTIPKKEAEIDVGSAGTAARFLTAMLGMSDGSYVIQASGQMKKRPMKDLFVLLEHTGAGSTFGNIFKITTWGESHGKGVGVVVDGCPAGLSLCEEDIQKFLNRRKPGQSKFTTPRKEDDSVEILSGVFEGKTTGTPISLVVYNKNQQSKDYSEIASYYRPGHADYTFDMKYGFRDYRGGGRSSGRETIGRVAAGAIAVKILDQLGIRLMTYSKSIGPIACDPRHFDAEEILKNPVYMPDADAAENAMAYLEACIAEQNSSGGVAECIISGVPAGIGDPVFEKLNANLAKAVMSIGAVKGFEIGDGFDVAKATGKNNNDAFRIGADGSVSKETNHAGGILGGMSDGSDIILRATIKPTPSISATQHTVNKSGEEIDINIKGRHDPIIVPRAVVVVESMAAITIVDAMFANMSARMDSLERFYK